MVVSGCLNDDVSTQLVVDEPNIKKSLILFWSFDAQNRRAIIDINRIRHIKTLLLISIRNQEQIWCIIIIIDQYVIHVLKVSWQLCLRVMRLKTQSFLTLCMRSILRNHDIESIKLLIASNHYCTTIYIHSLWVTGISCNALYNVIGGCAKH